MATSNAKKYRLKFEIPEISKLETFWSPEILICGIPWKIQVRKMEQDTEQYIGAFLCCHNEDESPNWSLWGVASFKLLPFSDQANPFEHHMEPYVFTNSEAGFGVANLIKWNDLFNQDKMYVKNDTINMEVEVNAEHPYVSNQSRFNFDNIYRCCENYCMAKFRLTVTNVLNLVAVKSLPFTLRGLLWYIQVSKARSSHLRVMLELSDAGIVPCNMMIKFISSKKNIQPIEKRDTRQYQQGNLIFFNVVPWDKLIKTENGFVNDNSITLEIEISTCNQDTKGKPIANRSRLQCPICWKRIRSQNISSTPCGHLFCLVCIETAMTCRATCPVCNVAVPSNALRRIYLPTVN